MWKNYLKSAWRNTVRQKGYAALNVAGLALGLGCCLLIALWVQDEHAYDRFHTQGDRIYRLDKIATPPTGGSERHALSSGPMGPTMQAEFPEVEAAVRLLPWFDDVLIERGETVLATPDVVFADANVFSVFSFRLLRGSPATALADPLSIVLTEHMAHALFGEADPIGQTIVGLNDLTYTVTGIVEDAPAHSHLRYNAFVSWASVVPGNGALEFGWLDEWRPQSLFTYLLLRPEADPAALEAKFPAFMQAHFAERADQYAFYLQPLHDVYLGSSDVLFQRSMVHGNRTYVYVLSVVALLILLIACVNFINLATARAGRRATEVGVRKAIGARRPQLVGQFLSEVLLLVGVALVLALGLAEAVRPAFNAFTGKAVGALTWLAPGPLAVLAALGLAVGLAAGLYPALVLSGFRPVRALNSDASVGGRDFRKVLVTAQFAASIVLLAGTFVVYHQMAYVQTRHPGYDRAQVVVLPTGGTALADQFEAFKTEVLRSPHVTAAAGSNSVPGEDLMSFGLLPEGRASEEGWTANVLLLDDDDLPGTYGMEMAAGRFLDSDRAADSSAIVVNETLARSLGWADPIGKRLDVAGEGRARTVVGVVRDFQTASLRQPIGPLFMILDGRGSNLSVRITGDDVPGTLAHLRATWERFEPRHPFEYRFLDSDFARLYATDRRLMQTLGLFALIAILVACLGLFGLAAYTAEQRTKEIGVRKVLGATVASLVGLLSRDFLRLVLVASVVAVPVAWYAMERWLDGFAYRIALGPVVFLLAGGIALLIALATVAGQALRAAHIDPVKSLRAE